MIEIAQVTAQQREYLDAWGGQQWVVELMDGGGSPGWPTPPKAPWDAPVFHNMLHNLCLWHHEDRVRSPGASDNAIAAAKRLIDYHNQQRNDWIDKLNERLAAVLAAAGVRPRANAPLNSETLGSAIDRLAILALRIFHLQKDDSPAALEKLVIASEQQVDLAQAAQELADDLFAGRKRHKPWRALKLYNESRK